MGSESRTAEQQLHKEHSGCVLPHSAMHPLQTFVAMVYPTYRSFRAIRTRNSEQALLWLNYWVVLGFICLLEAASAPFFAKMSPLSHNLLLILKWGFSSGACSHRGTVAASSLST